MSASQSGSPGTWGIGAPTRGALGDPVHQIVRARTRSMEGDSARMVEPFACTRTDQGDDDVHQGGGRCGMSLGRGPTAESSAGEGWVKTSVCSPGSVGEGKLRGGGSWRRESVGGARRLEVEDDGVGDA